MVCHIIIIIIIITNHDHCDSVSHTLKRHHAYVSVYLPSVHLRYRVYNIYIPGVKITGNSENNNKTVKELVQ